MIKKVHYLTIRDWIKNYKLGTLAAVIITEICNKSEELYKQEYGVVPNSLDNDYAYNKYNIKHEEIVFKSIIHGLRWGMTDQHITKHRCLKLFNKLKKHNTIASDAYEALQIEITKHEEYQKPLIDWLMSIDPDELGGLGCSFRSQVIDYNNGEKHSWQSDGPLTIKQLSCLERIMKDTERRKNPPELKKPSAIIQWLIDADPSILPEIAVSFKQQVNKYYEGLTPQWDAPLSSKQLSTLYYIKKQIESDLEENIKDKIQPQKAEEKPPYNVAEIREKLRNIIPHHRSSNKI